MKRSFLLNAKNILGKRTRRKIVVFDVDDYGNVRVHSQQARENLENAGLRLKNRYDRFDSLETESDFNELFEVLDSVKDSVGNPAIFTAYSLPANIDFETMTSNFCDEYVYELLPVTYAKLGADYDQMMSLWKQGIDNRLIWPEFHGREHLNVKLFLEKYKNRNPEVMNCLQNRSYTAISPGPYRTIKWNCAFDFDQFEENHHLKDVLTDGLNCFEKVFGHRASILCAPGAPEHPTLHSTAIENGIRWIESWAGFKQHQGDGQFKFCFRYTGRRSSGGATFIVRNCVFEPTEPKPWNWVDYTMTQIAAAFRWGKPAVISSHRVNFCGRIEPANREMGLRQLRELLRRIVQTYPAVEFMTTTGMAQAVGLRP